MEVTKENKDTVFSKIFTVSKPEPRQPNKSYEYNPKFEPKYVTVVLIAIPLFMLLAPFLLDWTWSQSIYRGIGPFSGSFTLCFSSGYCIGNFIDDF